MTQQYSHFIGKRIEVRYKAGSLHLSAAGILLSDDGGAICLQDHFLQNGKLKTMRVEVPYGCILQLAEVEQDSATTPSEAATRSRK